MPPTLDTTRVEFVKDFIATYKSLPVLWDISHPNHNNRNARQEAWNIVVNKCKEYDEEANIDFARNEIDKLRSHFRRERKKVLKERENGNAAAKSTLWFYKLLLFTVNAEDEASDDSINDSNDAWRRDRAVLLMKLLKNYPCLYAKNHPHYRRKVHTDVAYKAIADHLTLKTEHKFTPLVVRYKVKLLRKLFCTERARIRKEAKLTGVETPRLWCYNLLKFLDENCKQKVQKNEADVSNDLRDNEISEKEMKKEHADNFEQEIDTNSAENSNEPTEDIYDTIGRNVTHKLRQMTEQQRQRAAKILNDVMYHGLMENLTAQSQLILNNS